MPLTLKRLRAALWFTFSRWRFSNLSSTITTTRATRLSVILAALLVVFLPTWLVLRSAPILSRTAGDSDDGWSPPVHLLVADVQLDLTAPTAGPDRRLGRAIQDVASQSARRLVIHFIVDEDMFVRWQSTDKHSTTQLTDEADRDSLDKTPLLPLSSDEQERGWKAAVKAFHQQSAGYRQSLIDLLPWLPQHLHHLVILPYSYTRILALPWPDSPLTIGNRLDLLCTDLALTDCATTPTGVYLVKTMLGAILPQWVDHIIVLDSDLRVYGDIGDMLDFLRVMRSQPTTLAPSTTDTASDLANSLPSLWSLPFLSSLFSRPLRHPVMALAAEQQTFYDLRHPTVMRGRLGFNGGVQLQDLVELRRTEPGSAGREYNERLLTSNISAQFTMGLLLGDQTVYTALNNTAPHLFLPLPCQWNRQLCEYYYEPWRKRDVQARRCPGQWRIVHGNCAAERDTPEELGDEWRAFHEQQRAQAVRDAAAERDG